VFLCLHICGVSPAKDGVAVTDDQGLDATSGVLKLETPPRECRQCAHHRQLPLVYGRSASWTAVFVRQDGWKLVQTHASIAVRNDEVGWSYD
jgi:hypothetical protein